MLRFLLGSFLLLAAIIWLADNIWIALKTGAANAGGSLHWRRKNPLKYWVAVAVQAGFLIGFIAFFISFVGEFS